MSSFTIDRVTPQAGVRGGRVTVYSTGMAPQDLGTCSLVFGSNPTRPALISPTLLLGIVPANATPATIRIAHHGEYSNAVPFTVATILAENFHPVGNPAIDRQGTVYTTISGNKGQQVPASIYKITPTGEVEPFVSGIMNPTGLAFGPDGTLYVSSRHEGKLYRVSEQGTVSAFSAGIGIPTGLAFDPLGRLYVGDRRGTIYRVSESGETQAFAKLAQSVGAYHLAYGDDDHLYVSYPTLTGDDHIYRITPDGEVRTFARGLGGAQGLAFDTAGNLYVVAYRQGSGGVLRITPEGDTHQVIAGISLVGLAFGLDGALMLVDHSTLYALNFGVQGLSLS
ncbi:Virginiamycin B lyase [Candidatus Entotheonellaceae bacterium PAL068K]